MVADDRSSQIALAALRLRAALAEQKSQRDSKYDVTSDTEEEENNILDRFEDLGIADASSRSGSDSSPSRISPASTTRWGSIDRSGMPGVLDASSAQATRTSQSSRKSLSRPKSALSSLPIPGYATAPADDIDINRRPVLLNPAHRTCTTPASHFNPAACPVKIIPRAKSANRADSIANANDELEPLEEALVSCRDPTEYEVMRVQLLRHFLTEEELRKRHEILKSKYPNITYRPAVCKKDKKAQQHAHPEPLRKLTEAEIMRLVASPRGKDCVKELKNRREAKKWRETHLAQEINWKPAKSRPVDLDDLCLSPVDPIPEAFKEEAARRVAEIQRAIRESTLTREVSKTSTKRSSSSTRHGKSSGSSHSSGSKNKTSH